MQNVTLRSVLVCALMVSLMSSCSTFKMKRKIIGRWEVMEIHKPDDIFFSGTDFFFYKSGKCQVPDSGTLKDIPFGKYKLERNNISMLILMIEGNNPFCLEYYFESSSDNVITLRSIDESIVMVLEKVGGVPY